MSLTNYNTKMYAAKSYSQLLYSESVNFKDMKISVDFGDNTTAAYNFTSFNVDFFGGGNGQVATTGLVESVNASSAKRAFLLAVTQFNYDAYVKHFEIHALSNGSIRVYVRPLA